MRRGVLLCTVIVLAAAAGADAARTDISVQATPTSGAAPLAVTFTASEPVHWDFGDGQTADGPSVVHTYAAGRWHAVASAANGSASVDIVAHGIELAAPARVVRYGRAATFRGRLVPAERGVAVRIVGPAATVRTRSRADGAFTARARVKRAGTWHAETDVVRTADAVVSVVPRLRTGLIGSGARDSRYVFAASVLPRDAGAITVTIMRNNSTLVDRTFAGRVRIKLDTRRLTTYRIRAHVQPGPGYTAVTHVVRAHVVLPRLAYGVRSSAVGQLAQRLRELHYMAPFTATFDTRLLDAVYAFQKVQGLPRTGVVTAPFWRRLADPLIPIPRYAQPASHLEINKPRQVLYVVRGSRIAIILPISTAGIAGTFTPVGRFSIYRKVTGFDPSPLGTLYDPMYFTGGYAIHGNPSVPPYPASHGCVRVPMWIAPYLYATNPYGETVYVY